MAINRCICSILSVGGGGTIILLIDNYDSFTYNLVQYLQELGSCVQVRRHDEITLKEIDHLKPRHIIISPGPGRPENAGITMEVITELNGHYPILGICLGHQAIAQAWGGKVLVNWRQWHGKVSPIYHDGEGVFNNLPSPLKVVRYHSLVVDQATFPSELIVTASTLEDEIMGLRHQSLPIEGLQFHPESVLTEYGKEMLANFLSQY